MKNLEKEYKDQINREVPDLWSRIEAGVDAYEAKKSSVSSAETTPAPDTSADNITPIRKKNVIAIITRITAAAACVLLLAATVRITQRTGREASAPAPAAEAYYFEDAAPSPTPAEDTQYEEAMAEAVESEPNVDSELSYSPAAKEQADINDATVLSPSESTVIKEPVAFDDARDDLLPELELLGFRNISDFRLEDDVKKTFLERDAAKTDIDPLAASFTDSKTSTRYYVIYTINDAGKAQILVIRKDDDTGEILYTDPSVTE